MAPSRALNYKAVFTYVFESVEPMPTYEYVCPAGHAFEKSQKMSQKPGARCPECGKQATRKISGGVGLVFKGTGFYITDYGKDGKGPRKQPTEGGSEGTTESKPKTEPKVNLKPESKPASKPEKQSE